ncbi:hypothetical protein KVG29_05145 [Caldicoprobacter algeriensis]|uniref:hypothetical protein n=1 Tax=Caldicoprobacter algeriensis TaxID=699281 RepID=UPI00207A568B|nr:hypothetical protein [Caldicoprobacter algeriensis]MCM8900614.1 hypothetical protein [Caldicoprobacter algeriensis]
MKFKVIKAFIDKHTNKPYNSGYVYESDDLKRIAELQEAGYLEGVPLTFSEIETATIAPDEDAKLPRSQQKRKRKDKASE